MEPVADPAEAPWQMAGVAMADSEVGVPVCEPTSFRWSQRYVGDAVVLCLAGELDLATVELEPLLRGVAKSSPAATIVLDLSDVSFIDAFSIGVIMEAWCAAKARGRVLQVEGLHGLPARVFRIVGLEPVLARRHRDDISERECQ